MVQHLCSLDTGVGVCLFEGLDVGACGLTQSRALGTRSLDFAVLRVSGPLISEMDPYFSICQEGMQDSGSLRNILEGLYVQFSGPRDPKLL